MNETAHSIKIVTTICFRSAFFLLSVTRILSTIPYLKPIQYFLKYFEIILLSNFLLGSSHLDFYLASKQYYLLTIIVNVIDVKQSRQELQAEPRSNIAL